MIYFGIPKMIPQPQKPLKDQEHEHEINVKPDEFGFGESTLDK